MATSRLQRKVSKIVHEAFAGYGIRENSRPPWNLSDDGTRLELDFYIEELAVAIEVQGTQHLVFSEYFHGDHDGFERQKARDDAKAVSCNFYNVRLFEVFHDDDIPGVIEKIREIRDGRAKFQRKSGANWPVLLKKFNLEALAIVKLNGKHGALDADKVEEIRVKQQLVTGWITKFGPSIFDDLGEFWIEETMRNARKLSYIYEQHRNRLKNRKRAERAQATQKRHIARKQRRQAAEANRQAARDE
jgi:hypothetical protein